MKKATLMLTLMGLLTGVGYLAEARVYKPHSQVNDPRIVMQLHQQMNLLSESFVEIEEGESRGEVDYARILRAVEKMEAARQTVRQIVSNKAWAKPLNDLSLQLKQVRKAAIKENPLLLRREIDSLYQTCFKCHAANAPKYE